MIWRFFPLIGVLLFLGLGFGVRPWLQFRRYGTSGIWLFRSGRRTQHLRDGLFLLLVVLLTAGALTAAAWPDALSRAGRALPPAIAEAVRPLGAGLLFGGLALFLIAQLNLGASWRIGIEETARPGLVTGGLYRFCRNPIFLFMATILVGFTLLLPMWLSLGILAGALIGIRQQVADEEAHLLRMYGEKYRSYARSVGRFLPWLGRLR